LISITLDSTFTWFQDEHMVHYIWSFMLFSITLVKLRPNLLNFYIQTYVDSIFLVLV